MVEIKKHPLKSRVDMEKLQRGDYDYGIDSDNKVIAKKCGRWLREQKAKIYITQAEVFAYYNKNMRGIGKMDQLIAAYRTRMRQKKWNNPKFTGPILNVTVPVGREAVIECGVDNLSTFKVCC
ncbi:hypothetical protein ILUMI_23815 [Ignelater luminosus]|uniref:PiggyBac transposable element-derived protein domain-containing protein n=1 Tax=Ignelater luminosus TaxID=2038154 RepID=A0A8K0G1I6_IGNLU|nr:hypothetical protein ILUMI_23815 [Ignelater luminosus]